MPNRMECWKLNVLELQKLVNIDDATRIVQAAMARRPGEHAKEIVKVFLNKAKTIWVQNVRFYGGEHFNEPYYFVAEIRHITSNSAFSRWFNPKRIARHHFTY